MDNFEIITKIGEGAYSSVYTVRRKTDNQLYALKKVRMKSLSPKEKQNALNEVRILASIKSPYVISYKEAFVDEKDSTLCIVMEYAEEGDLFQKITVYKKRNVFFEESDIWRIFIQITKCLHDLHKCNILHRDMKSANVFLFKNGTAKLGDLNVSKLSHRGLVCTQTGTPYYASPEIWKDVPYDYKSDIWSLGCVLYEMIMFKTPFRSDTMDGLCRKIMKGIYPKISKNYSDDLSYVISLLLTTNAKARPSTDLILTLPEIKIKIEEYDVFKYETPSETKKPPFVLGSRTPRHKQQYDVINKGTHNEMLETIKMPKKLMYLNKHLPTSNYETDIIEEKQYAKNENIKNMSFPNKLLPMISSRYILKQDDTKKKTLQFKLVNKPHAIVPGKIDMKIEE